MLTYMWNRILLMQWSKSDKGINVFFKQLDFIVLFGYLKHVVVEEIDFVWYALLYVADLDERYYQCFWMIIFQV